MPAIQTMDLTKKFEDVTAVNAVNLEISEGELFGLLGFNRAGKRTLTSMLCTILRPTSGRGLVWNHDLRTEQDEVRKSIGVVFQDPGMDDDLTGSDQAWPACCA